ncbi:MAG: hypothetical protein ACHQVK_04560, partial [Candidatus Paceibacterales bacterium]
VYHLVKSLPLRSFLDSRNRIEETEYMNKSWMFYLAILVGIGFMVAAYVYWTTPANTLPSYFPGYDTNLTRIHTTHANASFIIGIASFAFAWFRSGKKSTPNQEVQE